MHRQTIDAYDADARRWLTTRYDPAREKLPAASQFRRVVGDGLIVDLGCGPGQLLGDLGDPCIGIDASSGMLALAKELGGEAPLVQGDAEVLPLRTDVAAGVWANFSLQHLPRPGFRAAIREAARVLRPGGHLEVTMHGRHGSATQQPDGVRPNDDIPGGRWFTYWLGSDVVEVLEGERLEVVEEQDLGYANRFLARLTG